MYESAYSLFIQYKQRFSPSGRSHCGTCIYLWTRPSQTTRFEVHASKFKVSGCRRGRATWSLAPSSSTGGAPGYTSEVTELHHTSGL